MALALEDCMCPICMCIMVEPVTMPCTHTLCYPCFKQNVEEASLTCPMCRTRISNWARRAAKSKTLLNKKLWDEIQTLFPDKVQKRQAGQEDDSIDDTVYMPIISIAKPGEIRQEYEEQLQRLQAQREAERKKELEASEALIKRLQEEENMKSREQESIEERDRELATELEKVINEAGSDSPINVLMMESKNRLTRSTSSVSSVSASSSRPPSTIETFIHKMREAEKLKAADQAARNNSSLSPYPYKCFSPTLKANLATGSMATSSSRSFSSGGLSVVSSRSCTSSSELEDSGKLTDCNNILSNHTPSNLSLRISSLGSTYGIEETNFDEETNSDDPCASDKNKRSSSTLSSDSISQELSHFRPIKACPLTPPRKLPSGKVIEPPLIRTTPRNLNKCEFGSPPRSLSDIDASSPIMQRRLSELEEERKCQVNKLSKSTSTGGPATADNVNLSNTPSQSKAMLKVKNCSVNIDNCKNQNTDSKCLPCEVVTHENDFSDMPKLTKCVIPLEPIFDDDSGDFDIAPPPLNEICNIDNIKCNVISQTKQKKKNKSSSKSETNVIAKINSKELENMNTDHRKSRKLSVKGKKDVHKTITPQKSIKDWIFSSNKSASMDLLKDVINTTSAKGDDVDGTVDLTDETPGKYTGVTGDDVVPACTGDASDSQSKRIKLYPFRKRRKRTYDHSDFIFPDWSPRKAKIKMEQLMYNTDEDESETDVAESTLKQKSVNNRSVRKRIRLQESDDEIAFKKRKNSNHEAKSNKKETSNSKLKSLKSARMIKSMKRNLPKKINSIKTIDHYWKTSGKEDFHSDDPVDNITSTLSVEADVSFSKEKQEMLDRKLAEELAKQFQVEAKMRASFFRTKGSSEEYNFRRRRQFSTVDV